MSFGIFTTGGIAHCAALEARVLCVCVGKFNKVSLNCGPCMPQALQRLASGAISRKANGMKKKELNASEELRFEFERALRKTQGRLLSSLSNMTSILFCQSIRV